MAQDGKFIINADNCIGCGQCVDNCPMDAITLNNLKIVTIDEKKCGMCGQCSSNCPMGAIVVQGGFKW